MTVREMVSKAIPDGAFLRRDRENALFITNAPAKGEIAPLYDFIVEINGPMARIHIKPSSMERISNALDLPDSILSHELTRFKETSPEAAQLFSDILKALDNPPGADFDSLDRRVRRAAAVAMRSGGGDGLYHCAKALSELENIMKNETEERK